ncbi:MAG: hypothetical protein IKL68_04060 [Clostridia bacterium]|nr:hypothetical protein [Clostridia bacterium]
MKRKQGVTVLALSIAVAIMAILTAAAIINIDNIIPTARKSKIAEEFELIQDKVKEYYLTYGNYPVLNDTTYTKAEVVALNTNEKAGDLSDEIDKNGDENSIFFLIDLEKLRINTLLFGNNNTSDDIYIAASSSGTVYYPKGVIADGITVFSTGGFKEVTNIE